MRKVSSLALLLLFFLTTVSLAQTDIIGAYADAAGTDCNIVDGTGNFMTVYIVHSSSVGATASSFSAPKPGCFTGLWLSDTIAFPIHVGDSQNGVDISYGSCQTGSFLVLTISYYAPGVTPDCCPYTVLPHDGSLPPIVEVVDCSFNTLAGVGETSQINKTAACECCPGGTIYVPPYPNIQTAIDAACSGDTIVLADGTYIGPGNRDLVISEKSLTIRSAGGDPANCTISAQGSAADQHFGFDIDSHDGDVVVIEGIRIEKSHHSSGRPIWSRGTTQENMSLVLRDCWIRQNEHGALSIFTDLTVENCRFEDNTEEGLQVGFQSEATISGSAFEHNNGSGLFIDGAGVVRVNDCGISDNAEDGIRCEVADSLSVRNTTISENFDDGVYLNFCNAGFDSCTISSNTGGAVRGDYCGLTMSNCILNGNQDGAILADHVTPVLDGCTLYGNSGILILGGSPMDNGIRFFNCILAFNPAGTTIMHLPVYDVECTDIYGNTGGDWVGNLAPFEGLDGNISLDPLFCDPPTNDYHLQPGSPCDAACGLMGAKDIGCDGTAVETPNAPSGFALRQNVPNPFNPSTAIRFDVPAGGGIVTLKIYDVSGRLVRTLVDSEQTPGEKAVSWDGKSDDGRNVVSGVYFYRLNAPGFSETRKMVLLR